MEPGWRPFRGSGPGVGLRESCLWVALAFGLVSTVLTEILTAARGLTPASLWIVWTLLAATGLLVAWRHLRTFRWSPVRDFRTSLSSLNAAMGAWIVIVVLLTAANAVLAAPTNWDAMTYHLARVAHWAQNRGVTFYPTNIVRQLYQGPFAESAILQLYLLGGGDRFVNLVQWFSMVGCVIGVSLIARELGAGPRGQVLGGFVCATIPMGMLQASSTQNDYVVAFWLVCFVFWLLVLRSRPRPGIVLAAGASLGLALLTKGTAYMFAAAFALGLIVPGSVRLAPLRLKQAFVIGVCALAINAPHYARNLDAFGTFLGQNAAGEPYINERFSMSILSSNVMRNLGLHLGTPQPRLNVALQRAVSVLHRWIGVPVDNPPATWPGFHFEILPPNRMEDFAGNGPHLLLTIASGVLLVWRQFADRLRIRYLACLILAFLLFNLLLRWQPFHSRLQLPLFVLAAALVACAFERANAVVLFVVASLLAVLSWAYLTDNESRPPVGQRALYKVTRVEQRVAHTGASRPEYLVATAFLRSTGCLHVGLVLGPDDPEYSLWDLLPEVRLRGRFEHVLVSNASARFVNRQAAFHPCAIIRTIEGPVESVTVGTQAYRSAWASGTVQVLVEASERPGHR